MSKRCRNGQCLIRFRNGALRAGRIVKRPDHSFTFYYRDNGKERSIQGLERYVASSPRAAVVNVSIELPARGGA